MGYEAQLVVQIYSNTGLQAYFPCILGFAFEAFVLPLVGVEAKTAVNKYIDLVFYNYILRCFVLVDLKTAKLTSRDIGQMDAYRRMFDTLKRQPSDQQTIGILLGTEIDEPEVKYSIMAECEHLFATKLMPYLPTKAELQCEIERSCLRTNLKKQSAKSALPRTAIGRS